MSVMNLTVDTVRAGASKTSETMSLLGCATVLALLFKDLERPEQADAAARSLLHLPPHAALASFAKTLKLKARFKRMLLKAVGASTLPIGFRTPSGEWIVLARLGEDSALLQRPGKPNPEIVPLEQFRAMWSGRVVTVRGANRSKGDARPFDVTWFIPEFLRFKAFAGEIFAASLCIELLALIFPLFFQVAMDKVIANQASTTLDVLVFALIVGAVLEVGLRGLRQYMATQTTTRIDARLGGKLFRRLVDLPIAYFQSRSVGITVMRLTELESIREFLSGAANTLVIDLLFTFVFLAVMYYYSPLLTCVVALSIPCYCLISYLTAKPLQRRIEAMARDASLNNAYLTETLGGIETVKSLALEPQMVRRWEEQAGAFASSNYRVQKLMNLSANLVQFVQKATMAVVLWFGAKLVITQDLSIGQFIAFNMMANHVSQPILRLSELWRNYVQARVSVDRLADVLNTPTERSEGQQQANGRLEGEIRFEAVSFGYAPNTPPILKDFNLTIAPGSMVALVGASGSGKSTVARLVQKLYVPQQGRILVDGLDMCGLDAVFLRQRMSVVLQENFLFNMSVRDNIALTEPAAPMAKVIEAAELAGAHEFILELPEGYDTVIAEGGTSLSGGQRQRMAIARALMSDPSILIFDEATSALDDHSQAIVQRNMAGIRQGRTVIVIAHRLSTVRDSDCIVVMDKGAIVEMGRHDDLLRRGDAYARLWALQSGTRQGIATPRHSIRELAQL